MKNAIIASLLFFMLVAIACATYQLGRGISLIQNIKLRAELQSCIIDCKSTKEIRMRQFNPLQAGISPEALETSYNYVLQNAMILEYKLERIKKELATTICMMEDGKKVKKKQIKRGFSNLINYIDAKVSIESEMNFDKTSIELVNEHVQEIKKVIEELIKK